MSKVICDVCGTAYPETSAQCPICGCAKKSGNQTAAADTSAPVQEETSGYNYVKGGRFSKKNVRRRNTTRKSTPERRVPVSRQEEEKANAGLIVVVILLLLAIVAVVFYIGFRFFLPQDGDRQPSGTVATSPTGGNTNDPTSPTDKGDVPATGLKLSYNVYEFLKAGDTFELKVELQPADTTDKVSFSSSNKEVAMVSDKGVVMAVGHGEAVITVTAGKVKAECAVVCSFGGTVDPNPDKEFVFKFNTRFYDEATGKSDASFDARKKWTAYTADLTVDPADITWISDNPAVCTIDNGIVTIVGRGQTEIHAQYNGKTYTCIIRSTVSESAESTGDYKISHTDVTLQLSGSKSFTLKLTDKAGAAVNVQWTAKNPAIVTIDGNKITGIATGSTQVSAVHEGVTYTCIIYVKK